MDIILVTTVVASLFLVIGVAEPFAARLRLPYSVILAVFGTLIGAGATFLLRTELTDALNPVAEAIVGLPIRSNVFLYVFLPTLLFQATLGMNLRRMLDDWVPILVLAVVAVVVATLSVGYALAWVSPLPLVACLLIGAIVSTTDPSAVVSIFRSISAPRRLARIIEGESLLNDAARNEKLTLLRYLRARDCDVGKALEMMEATARFRATYCLDDEALGGAFRCSLLRRQAHAERCHIARKDQDSERCGSLRRARHIGVRTARF